MKRQSLIRKIVWFVLLCCLGLQISIGTPPNSTLATLSHEKKLIGGQSARAPFVSGLAVQKAAQQKALYASDASTVRNTSFVDFYNWSGWMAGQGTGVGFKAVQGNWNVQCFSGAQSNTIQESTWVGLGGNFANDRGLVQTGTEKDPNGNVYLFWEAFNADGTGPNNGYPISNHINISCGHAIHAVVLYHPSGCTNGFTTQIQDITGGTSYNSGCLVLTGGHQSAEWVDERPDCGAGYNYTSLADFNTTSWSNVLTELNVSSTTYVSPMAMVPTQMLMQDSGAGGTGAYLASPDGIEVNSNNTFIDRWYAYGNSYGSCSGV